MYKVRIYIVGRYRNNWIEQGVEEYLQRMRGTLRVETFWVRDNGQLEAGLRKESSYWCLDPQGELLDSPSWAAQLRKTLDSDGGQLALVIGGADGLPPKVKKESERLVSFSLFTFPHLLCRLLLMEQLYRASQIWRKTPYHK